MLGLVGPVSVYCDWVNWKVGPATSMSVWQHVKLSEQIRPRDTLACCWDVKQPTNKLYHLSRTCPLLHSRSQTSSKATSPPPLHPPLSGVAQSYTTTLQSLWSLHHPSTTSSNPAPASTFLLFSVIQFCTISIQCHPLLHYPSLALPSLTSSLSKVSTLSPLIVMQSRPFLARKQ